MLEFLTLTLQTGMLEFLQKNDFFLKKLQCFSVGNLDLDYIKVFFVKFDNSWLFTLKLNHSFLKERL